jgi:ribonuclease D
LYLHKIKEELDKILIRENRMELAEHCFKFLKHRVTLDLAGWNNQDIFAH